MTVSFHVAPGGDDHNPGTIDRPFATLERARDAVRNARKEAAGPIPGGATVWLAQGVYPRTTTLELGPEDSGAPGAPIVYRARPGHHPRIMGGRPIAAWTPVQDAQTLARLNPSARPHVLQADLRALGVTDLGSMKSRGFGRKPSPAGAELFFDLEPMTIARFPNRDWLTIESTPEAFRSKDDHGMGVGKLEGGFHYSGDRPASWAANEDIWVHGYWAYDWANTHERVASIDHAQRLIKTHPPHGQYAFAKGQRFCFLNVLEELDAPGEYYVDRQRGLLYFWPPRPIASGEATLSLLSEPLVRIKDASHIVLRGLTLECTRGDAVLIARGDDCLVAGCTIRDVGNGAVVIRQGAGNAVRSCDIHHTGDGGVTLDAGDRATLTPAGHVVENCHFHHLAYWSRCYYPAVLARGVGFRIAHNLIHDHPHCAILYQGNDITVEFNEIYNVCTETGDVGAVYTGRDWTARGDVVRHNFIHHVGGVGMGSMAVYLDDCASGQLVEGNVFYRTQRASFIGGGRDNHTINNIFVECQPAVMVDARGLSPAPVWRNMVDNYMLGLLKQFKHDQPPYSTRFPELAQLDALYAAKKGIGPDGTKVLRNISVGGQWLVIHWHAEPGHVQEKDNLVTADAGFADPEAQKNLDFRLRDDSPAFKLGFARIPMEKIGLFIDEDRIGRPRVMSRLDAAVDPADPMRTLVRLTLRNTGETRWEGRASVAASPAGRAIWEAGRAPELARVLEPGQSVSEEYACRIPAGRVQFDVVSSTPGLRPSWLPYNHPQPIKRVDASPEPQKVSAALEGQPAWILGEPSAPLAWARAGLTPQDLAVHVRVAEARPTTAALPWEGSCVELFLAGGQGSPIAQFFLLPQSQGLPEKALRAQGEARVEAPGVRVRSVTTQGGYELAALIPLALVPGFDPQGGFLMDLAVSMAADSGGKYARAVLSGNPNAYRDTTDYLRVLPARR